MFPNIPPISFTLLILDSVRIMFFLGFFLYLIFAFIAVRQISIMRKTVITPFAGVIQVIGILHLLLAFGLLIFSFIYLA